MVTRIVLFRRSKAAKLMQRCEETFDRQSAVRMEELTVLQLAEMEFAFKPHFIEVHGLQLWIPLHGLSHSW